jgi:hypothetical protein
VTVDNAVYCIRYSLFSVERQILLFVHTRVPTNIKHTQSVHLYVNCEVGKG